jgi:hypothetical protein
MPQSDAEITRDLNLLDILGIWRVDCSKPVGTHNNEAAFEVTPAGLNVIHHEIPGSLRTTSIITGITVISPTAFILQIKGGLGGSPSISTTYVVQAGGLQVWATSETGQVTIDNGKDVASGIRTPVWRKCA